MHIADLIQKELQKLGSTINITAYSNDIGEQIAKLGNENRYVMNSFAELANWYTWAINKGWDVIQALPLTHDPKLE